jgi:hypothetical protein
MLLNKHKDVNFVVICVKLVRHSIEKCQATTEDTVLLVQPKYHV